MQRRKYTLKQRAAQQEETRQRIVDAAVALHEELGPAATTISALAERAGVQRLTVYRHFPSEQEIFSACSAKWLSRNPPPDPAAVTEGDSAQRTQAILLALYGYYRKTQAMWDSLYRDLGRIDALDEPMAGFDAYLASVEQALLAAWAPRKTRRLRATLAHAIRFSTWQSLAGQGLSRKAMAELAGAWINAVAD